MRFNKGKKGNLAILQTAFMSLFIIAILLGVVLTVLSKFYDKLTVDSTAAQAVNTTIGAIADIPGWLPIIVIMIVAVVVLYYVFAVMPRGRTAV